MPAVLNWLSRVALYDDDWPAATAYAQEARVNSVSAPGEQVFALVSQALIDSHLGDAAAARAATDTGIALAQSTGIVSAQLDHQAVRGALELSTGDLDAALRFLGPLPEALTRHGFGEPAVFRFHPGPGRGARRVRGHRRGDRAARRAGSSSRRLPRSWAPAAAARCRGLVAAETGDQETAFAQFESALVQHDRTGARFERGAHAPPVRDRPQTGEAQTRRPRGARRGAAGLSTARALRSGR